MGFLKISPEGTSTLVQFAGDVLNKIHDYLSGINIAQADATNKPDIATETRFRTGNLRIFDNDRSHEFYFDTSAANIAEHKKIIVPSLTSSQDTMLFASQPAVLLGKTIDYTLNTLLNFPVGGGGAGGALSAGGVTTKSGNASTSAFTIAHGLSSAPDTCFVHSNSIDARGDFIVTKDATNITITYAVPPPSGTNNLSYMWGAGYVVDPQTGNDWMTFTEQPLAPGDPQADELLIYMKPINANNNGLFVKCKKGGVIVEGQIF